MKGGEKKSKQGYGGSVYNDHRHVTTSLDPFQGKDLTFPMNTGLLYLIIQGYIEIHLTNKYMVFISWLWHWTLHILGISGIPSITVESGKSFQLRCQSKTSDVIPHNDKMDQDNGAEFRWWSSSPAFVELKVFCNEMCAFGGNWLF